MGFTMAEMHPSKYLKAADIGDHSIAVVIENMSKEKMPDGGFKYVLHFTGQEKGVVLNVGNTFVIGDAYGEPGTENGANWQGKPVELYTVMTQNKEGKPCKGIRIRAKSSAPPSNVIQQLAENTVLPEEEEEAPFSF